MNYIWAWDVETDGSDEPMLIVTPEPTLTSLDEELKKILEKDQMVTKVKFLTDVANRLGE